MRASVPLARALAVMAIGISVCAFPAGPGSAAASAPPDGGHISSISCPSPGECTAVGNLGFGPVIRPLVVSEKGGVWGSAGTLPGLPSGDRSAGLETVSCSSAGNCSAGGCYPFGCPGNAPAQALVVTETNGVWGKAEAVPGLAALNIGRDATLDLMSCRSAGDCTASGTYPDTRNNDLSGQVFVVSERNGTWGRARPVPGLAAIDHEIADDEALSCGSPGNCVLSGTYTTRTGNDAPYVASQENGVWGPVRTFPAIVAEASGGAGVNSMSCQPSGACTGTGTWYTSDSVSHVFAINRIHGTWGAARPISGIAALLGGGTGTIGERSTCPSAGNCTIGGSAFGRKSQVPFVVAEKNGTWGRARALPGIAALNLGKQTYLAGLACFPGGNCTAVGGFEIRTKAGRFTYGVWVTTERNGVWARKAARMPSTAALGKRFSVQALSCGAPGDCGAGGGYAGKHSTVQPFVAIEKSGTWGKAHPITGIKPPA
jgi:hypothetical protein